jgi:hypothetical protein
MLVRAALVSLLIISASCKTAESGDPAPVVARAGSAAAASPGGKGFSADLAMDMESGPKKPGEPKKPTGSNAAVQSGSEAGSPAPSGSASDAARAGAAAVETREPSAPAPKPAIDAAKAGAAPAPAPKPDAARVGDAPKAGGESVKAGDPAKAVASAVPASAPARPDPTTTVAASAPVRPPSRGPVKVSADLAAIKLSLLPNWDRDIDEAGTFQYVVRIKGTQSTKTFSFRYGYDDPGAPTDRELYKKYLQDARLMTGEIKDRQRGSAWFLEGNDASGLPAFRYVVLYGGKRLICYGSMYRDAESNPLGDDRDQTVIQAKQICESLSL